MPVKNPETWPGGLIFMDDVPVCLWPLQPVFVTFSAQLRGTAWRRGVAAEPARSCQWPQSRHGLLTDHEQMFLWFHPIKTMTSWSAPLLPTKQKKPNTNWKPMDQNTGPIVASKRMHFRWLPGIVGLLRFKMFRAHVWHVTVDLTPETRYTMLQAVPSTKASQMKRGSLKVLRFWRVSICFYDFYVFKILWLERSWNRH